MADTIQYGEFQASGDQYTLRLNPIINVLSFQSYTDVVIGELVDSYLVRDFRYSVNNGASFSSWTTLNNTNLQAIAVLITDKVLMEVRYTRLDIVPNAAHIKFTEFILDNIQVESHVALRINKTIYDNLFGVEKYLKLMDALSTFNVWSVENTGVFVYIQDDNTIPDQQIKIDNVLSSTVRDVDFNILLRTDFGKRLVRMFTVLGINPNYPRV